MLRVLTLSTLFPDASRPEFGRFVERQTRALAAQPGVEVRVMAPVGLPPWPFSLHPRYRRLAALPAHETWRGLKVDRPRFRVRPGASGSAMPGALASALLHPLRQLRAKWRFDVIDAEYFFPDAPAAMHLSRGLGVPFSAKARGSDIHLWGARPACRREIVAAGRAAGGLLAVSGPMRDDMVALGMPADRIRVHHTGVELDRFRPADRECAKAALRLSGPVVAGVGTLSARKGHDLTIRALAELPGMMLILVGTGPDRERLRALAVECGVADRVRFPGAASHEELPAILQAADVMCLPSASEGLANAWVEAVACGVPVVAGDVGGIRELLDRAEAGRIVAREPGAVAAAIRALVAHPPDPDAVRAAAARFTWDANGAALADHLRALVEGHRPAA